MQLSFFWEACGCVIKCSPYIPQAGRKVLSIVVHQCPFFVWIHRLLGFIFLVILVLKEFFSGWMSTVCLFCLQAAPAAEDPPSAEAPEAKPETKETDEAKADAVEEVRETAEARHVEQCVINAHSCSF